MDRDSLGQNNSKNIGVHFRICTVLSTSVGLSITDTLMTSKYLSSLDLFPELQTQISNSPLGMYRWIPHP